MATARGHFTKLGYTVAEPGQTQGDTPLVVDQMNHELRSSTVAIKQKGLDFRFVLFHVVPSVTANICNAYRYGLIFHPFYSFRLFRPPRRMPKDIHEQVIVCSMQAGALRRLRSNLSMLHVGETEGTLRYDVEDEFPRPGEMVKVMRHLTFHVLDTSAKLATLPAFLNERFTRRLR